MVRLEFWQWEEGLMNIWKVIPKKHCLFFHRWDVNTYYSDTYTVYEECTKCGAKRISQASGGYQPIYFDFLQ